MKKKYKKILIAELIILGVLILIVLVKYWDTFEKPLEYLHTKKPWILWLIGTILAVIQLVKKYFTKIVQKFFTEKRFKLNRKPTRFPLPIFEVKNTEDLEKVANAVPFMENLAIGKVKTKFKKTWNDVKREIDFSKFQPIDLSTQHRIFFIIGKPGAGKSTYMLWSIDESLRKSTWSFDKVVFLNPNPDAYPRWAESLSNYDPQKTLLVIDALWRASDTPEVFKSRCLYLFRLAFEGELVEEKTIGPFKVLVTIREDEYENLISQKEFSWARDAIFEYFIELESLDFREILKKYLNSYKIPYNIPSDREGVIIEQLEAKSERLPIYVRYLFEFLKDTDKSFSESVLNDFPVGMVNLLWQTIRKQYYIEGDTSIPFLLLLLAYTNKYFSHYFFDFAIEEFAKAEVKNDAINKIERLKKYFQVIKADDIKDAVYYSLTSHLKEALKIGLELPNIITPESREVVNFYKVIRDTRFNGLLETIARRIETHLNQSSFKEKADVFLCLDLAKLSFVYIDSAKLSEENLNRATDIYMNFSFSSHLKEYINYAKEKLYELWINRVWEYRADPQHNFEDVIRCYENAFDKLGATTHLRQLSGFAYYLQTKVLPIYKYGTQEFERCKERIENLHNDVIKGQLERGIKDPVSYFKFALFYENIGEDDKAEEYFQEALKINPSNIPANLSYALFLKEKSRKELVRDRAKALEYHTKAEEQFKKLIGILEDKRKEFTPKEIEEYEKRILSNYAQFLIEKTKWERDLEKRLKIDEEVDELYDKLLKKYPNSGELISPYHIFLVSYGRMLPKYRSGKNLEKAENLLKEFIEFEKRKKVKNLSYYIALHLLAVYYYKFKPAFYKQPPNWEDVIKLLKESASSFNPIHNLMAYNELGMVYMKWARIDLTAYKEKMELAKEAFNKAIEIAPENPQSAIHLSKVYFNYAFYFEYMNQGNESEKCIMKALDIVDKFSYIPFDYYYLLITLGNEFLKDHELDIAERIFTEAKRLGERLQINPSLVVYKLAEIYKEKKDMDLALDYYLLSAELENTPEGWRLIRNSIKQMMKKYNIKKDEHNALYRKCIEACVYCSEKAYNLNPDDSKNCGCYGEDLAKIERFQDALTILENGVNLVLRNSQLPEIEKRKRVGFFYTQIGFCYKSLGNYIKAEEFFDKGAEIENSATGYLNHISQMYNLGKYEKAVSSYQKFVEKFPYLKEEEKKIIFEDLTYKLKKVAESYEKLGKENEMILAWKYYADLSFYSDTKNSAIISGIIGNKLFKKRKFNEARDCFLKSVRLKPDDPQNLSQLGYINKILQRYEEGMICYERALNIRGDQRDKTQYEFCQEEYRKNPKTYKNKIDDLIDLAVIEELKSNLKKALEYYKNALYLLSNQESQSENLVSRYKFIADAFWGLGYPNDALKLYEEKIKDMVEGQEKIIVEAIIWFIYRELLRENE